MAILRIEELESLARVMVGDGKSPNVYFVGVEGNLLMITLDVVSAYRFWQSLAHGQRVETSLEDRKIGVIASVEPEEDGSQRLTIRRNVELLPAKEKKSLRDAGLI